MIFRRWNKDEWNKDAQSSKIASGNLQEEQQHQLSKSTEKNAQGGDKFKMANSFRIDISQWTGMQKP